MISRVHSFECPVELEEGMVFALETYCAATDGRSAARIEEEVVVTKDGNRILTRFPAEELLVAGKAYVRGADILRAPSDPPRTHDALPARSAGRRSSSSPRFPDRAEGLTRQVLIGGATGATHTGLTTRRARGRAREHAPALVRVELLRALGRARAVPGRPRA